MNDHILNPQVGNCAKTMSLLCFGGNIPLNINTNKLMNMLNATLKELGKNVGVSFALFIS